MKPNKEVAQQERDIFSANFKRILVLRGKTQADIAADLGLTSSTVSDWANAKKYPRVDKMQALADYLDVLISDLRENRPHLPYNAVPAADLFEQCPVYGNVRGGAGGMVTGEITGYTMVMKNLLVGDKNEYFCLNVVGDSMEPRICEGDTVLVRSQQAVNSGDIAVVTIDEEEGVVKKMCHGTGWVELKSFNPYYPPRRFEGKEVERLHVTGKVLRIVDRKL